MRLNLVFVFLFLILAFTKSIALQAEDALTVTPTVGPLTPSQTIQPLSGALSKDQPAIPSFYIWRREYQKDKKTHYKLFRVYGNGAYTEEKNPTETYENWVTNINPGGGTPKGIGIGLDILTSPSQKWSIHQSTDTGDFVLHLYEGNNAVPQNIMIPDSGGPDDSDHWWWEGVDWNPVRDLFYITICIGTSTDRQFIYWQFDPTAKTFINVGTGQDLFLSPNGNWAVWMDGFWGDWRRDQLHIYDIVKNKNYQITSGDSDNVFYKWEEPAMVVTKGTTAEDFINNGKTAYLQHNYPEAIALYQKAIQIDSNNAEAYGLLGYSEFRNGQLDDAKKDLEQSIKINPSLIMSHYNLALVYWAQGRKEDAVLQMQKTADLNPRKKKEMEEDPQFKKLINFIGQIKWGQKQFCADGDEKWFREIEFIWRGFFSDGLSDEEIEILKHQLHYESSIISEIVELNSMIRNLNHLGDESAQLGTNGSLARNPHCADEINAKYDDVNKKCILESHNLRVISGSKEPEFREWLEEEAFIAFKVCGGWMGMERGTFEKTDPDVLAQGLVDSFQQQKKINLNLEQINHFKKRVIFWFYNCNPVRNGTLQETKGAKETYENAYQDAIKN